MKCNFGRVLPEFLGTEANFTGMADRALTKLRSLRKNVWGYIVGGISLLGALVGALNQWPYWPFIVPLVLLLLFGASIPWAFERYDKSRGYSQAGQQAQSTSSRSANAQELLNFYAQGVQIRSELSYTAITDAQIDQRAKDADAWLNRTYDWIVQHMGPPAAMRFRDNSDKPSYSYTIDGQHSDDHIKLRNNVLNVVSGCLQNLQTLANTTLYDAR